MINQYVEFSGTQKNQVSLWFFRPCHLNEFDQNFEVKSRNPHHWFLKKVRWFMVKNKYYPQFMVIMLFFISVIYKWPWNHLISSSENRGIHHWNHGFPAGAAGVRTLWALSPLSVLCALASVLITNFLKPNMGHGRIYIICIRIYIYICVYLFIFIYLSICIILYLCIVGYYYLLLRALLVLIKWHMGYINERQQGIKQWNFWQLIYHIIVLIIILIYLLILLIYVFIHWFIYLFIDLSIYLFIHIFSFIYNLFIILFVYFATIVTCIAVIIVD